MKHSTGFALCLAVIVLTGMVTASVGLLLFKQQDVALLQQHIDELRKENQSLRARIESITLAKHAREPGEPGSPSKPQEPVGLR
jgi:Tfp pilus assembly protein PilN